MTCDPRGPTPPGFTPPHDARPAEDRPHSPRPPGCDHPTPWEVYVHLTEQNRYQDGRRWDLIGHFILFQSILAAAIVIREDLAWPIHMLVSFAGASVSAAWWHFLGENAHYLQHVTERRKAFEPSFPEEWVGYPGSGGGRRVMTTMRAVVAFFLAAWTAWFLVSTTLFMDGYVQAGAVP